MRFSFLVKVFLLLALTICFRGAWARADMEAICRGNVQSTTQWAEWGLALRNQVIQTCKKQDFEKCIKEQIGVVDSEYQKTLSGLINQFNNGAYSQFERSIMTTNISFWKSAAITALKTGKEPSVIANGFYLDCISIR